MDRRFLLVAGCALILLATPGVGTADETVRIMAGNLSTGNDQSYDPGEGLRIFQGLKPDIALIQEFNYRNNTAQDITDFVRTGFGEGFSCYRESESSDYLPNGIVSRYPILAAGEWNDASMPNRDFAWARIDIPGPVDLWAVSLHLSSKAAGTRQSEAAQIVKNIRSAIPEKDYLVVGGDLNTGSRHEQTISIFAAVAGETAPPKDSNGRTNTNRNGSKPLDWVLVDPDLARCQIPVVIRPCLAWDDAPGYLSYPTGLVFNSAIFPHLDWVSPVQQGDSRARGMQHMAVIKDFLIPAPLATPPAAASNR